MVLQRKSGPSVPKIVVAALLLAGASGVGADFEAGVVAYRNGQYEIAEREFRELAERGVVVAQTNLGYMYALGEGVPQNLEESARWFRKAAEGGSTAAQVTMGALVYHGEGVERDPAEAYAWFSIAAAGGQDSARDYLALLTSRLSEDELKRGRALSEIFYDQYGVHRTVSLGDS